MKKVYFIILLCMISLMCSQNFTDINAGIEGVYSSSVDWGDYDNDGDLDIIVAGETSSYPDYAPITKIYRNDSGSFNDINAGLPGISGSSVKWGDYDNDGDLDILLSGDLEFHDYITRIYRNDNGIFTDVNAELSAVGAGDVSWIDFDVDGDLDILISGYSSDDPITKIYRNDSGIFHDINAGLQGVGSGSASWADYDLDGAPDLLLTGGYAPYYDLNKIAIIYRNDSGIFTDIQAGLDDIVSGVARWGDYDNDGDPDIILTGKSAINNYTEVSVTKIYRNDLGNFTDINAGLEELTSSSASWGDYDNDGDLDILVNGMNDDTSSLKTILYSNDSGIFTVVDSLTGIQYGTTNWGDYDNDGDLDILLSGATGSYPDFNPVSKIYRNDNIVTPNIAPSTPDGLSAVVNEFDVTLSWNKATDNETSQDGLTYNLFIGTSAESGDILGSMSDIQNGYRKVVGTGNTFQNTAVTITDLGEGTYYWAVQTLDNNFSGSNFSLIDTFTTAPVLDPPVALPASGITGSVFNVNLEKSIGAKNYFLDVAYDSLFANYVPGLENKDISNVTTHKLEGLDANTDYYYRFRAFNNIMSEYSNAIHVKTSQFLDINSSLSGNDNCSVEWGDYDNDGDLDFLICGKDFSTVYRNDSGIFTDINADMKVLDYNSSTWGDYDNDGDLDILTTGSNHSLIYRNDSGVFTDIKAGLKGVYQGSARWGDYDSDGDLDILLTGGISVIYRNDEGSFTDIKAGLEAVYYSSADWGDYDSDGDLDVLLTGDGLSIVYRNDNGEFTDINADLTGVGQSSCCWGDYDCDGDLDILITGDLGSESSAKIYRNDAGSFIDINAGLYGLRLGSADWVDYDSDGDLDVFVTGWDGSGVHSLLYSNDSDVFTEVGTGIENIYYSYADWGDYDNDGDLDLIITGDKRFENITKIYQNIGDVQNTAPTSPTNLTSNINGFDVELSWEKSTDVQTPQDGLTYNIYIGTSPGEGNILSSMSDATNGYRKITRAGNTGNLNSVVIRNISSGTYYWSVQAVDNSLLCSEFPAEKSFVSTAEILTPIAINESYIFGKSFNANWEFSVGARGYFIDVATDSLFTNFVAGYENRDVYNVITYQVSGLEPDTGYYYRVRAYNNNTTESSNIISLRTLMMDFTDTENDFIEVQFSSADWGDYDNDGDLDIVLSGTSDKNDSGIFTDIIAGLPAVIKGSVEWGDYDNDGDLDLLITGLAPGSTSKIYRNDSGVFTDIYAGLQGVYYSSVAWGDYDNDGDLDVLIAGLTMQFGDIITKVYRNDSGSFTEINSQLPGINFGSVDWGDYDNDGDLDILICGYSYLPTVVSRVYRNDAGSFSDIYAGLPEVNGFRTGSWGDFDNDGDLDILLSGGGGTIIYRNDSGSFNYYDSGIIGLRDASAKWCDFDNDGDLDVSVCGNTGSYPDYIPVMILYNNEIGEFVDIKQEFHGIYDGSIDWGDYDNDGDLDLMLTGNTDSGLISKLFRNDISKLNIPPALPENLQTTTNGSEVTFTWDKSSDDHTPQEGLTYNIYIGSSSNTEDVFSGMSDLSNGFRKIAREGNTQQNNSWTIKNLPDGTYYWSVQAIDHCFSGSEFAPEVILLFTGIEQEHFPMKNSLFQNYPNPFNPVTNISYSLKSISDVDLNIYNIKGELVKNLVRSEQSPGNYNVKFDAENLSSGIYFYDLKIKGVTVGNKKMIIMK
jgi:hypothetical protein